MTIQDVVDLLGFSPEQTVVLMDWRMDQRYGHTDRSLVEHTDGSCVPWEVDHIIPVAAFKFSDYQTDPEEFGRRLQVCFSALNMQWLTRKENGNKTDKVLINFNMEEFLVTAFQALTEAKTRTPAYVIQNNSRYMHTGFEGFELLQSAYRGVRGTSFPITLTSEQPFELGRNLRR